MAETLGHYKILERVGAGGLGQVYRARDTKVGRTVLVKLAGSAITSRPDTRASFLTDARRAASVSHPNVATLFEVSDGPDGVFLAIEYVPGDPLRKEIAGRALNPRRAIEVAAQIADALAEAHALGVLHLDLCPDTVLISTHGMTKVLDLGLSSWTNGGRARAAAAAAFKGHGAIEPSRAEYLSPEQVLGQAVDERSDLFVLGSLFYEMLTGRPAFSGPTPLDRARAVVERMPPPPSTVNHEVPRELDELVARVLAKHPEDRPSSAAAFAADLRAAAAVLDIRANETAPPTVIVEPRKSSRGAVAVTLVVIIAAIVFWLWMRL